MSKAAGKDAKAKSSDLYLAASEESTAILKADPTRSASDPTLPIFRLAARDRLEQERKRFEEGDQMALLAAIRCCANHDLVMPEWVSRGFIKGYDAVLNYRASSWDDVFGRPLPKGKHLAALRKKRLTSVQVWNEVRAAVLKGESIEDDFFSRVGAKLAIGKTLASEYYYAFAAQMPAVARSRAKKLPQKTKTSRKDNRRQ